jgi:hypothetical protein
MAKGKQKQGEKSGKGLMDSQSTKGSQGTNGAEVSKGREAKDAWGEADRRIWKRLKPFKEAKASTAAVCEALGQFSCEASHSGTRDGLV